MKIDVFEIYSGLCRYYKLTNKESKYLWQIIKGIANHPEFIKRCMPPFFHHDDLMLGEHIMADAIVTYKYALDIKDIDIKTAVVIAMFHDLYVEPWQNNPKKKKMCNKHAFVHPIEAIVNAITWYPEYFKNKDKAMVIIDGVLHHMYPLAVRRIDDLDMDLNNNELYLALPDRYKDMIKLSLSSAAFSHYSLRKSFFPEGRIMSKADKKVSFTKDFRTIYGYLAILGIENKNIVSKEAE